MSLLWKKTAYINLIALALFWIVYTFALDWPIPSLSEVGFFSSAVAIIVTFLAQSYLHDGYKIIIAYLLALIGPHLLAVPIFEYAFYLTSTGMFNAATGFVFLIILLVGWWVPIIATACWIIRSAISDPSGRIGYYIITCIMGTISSVVAYMHVS